MIQKIRFRKKGQEEMVGFMLIVVLVVVAFLVFIGISLRQNTTSLETESRDVYQFLESAMELTTNCSIDSESNFFKVSDLIGKCYTEEGQVCASGERACTVMNITLRETLESSWIVSGESFYKGYVLQADYLEDGVLAGASSHKYFPLSIKRGSCENTAIVGNEYLIPRRPGAILVEMKLCTSSLVEDS